MMTAAPTLTVRAVRNAGEMERVNRLIARVQLPPTKTCLDWLESVGATWPLFKREHARQVLLGDRLVGALRLHTYSLRIGIAKLKAGGIGWVSTDPNVRGQGVCRALMTDLHDYMAQQDYAVSILYGIPDLYERFGYIAAIPYHAILVRSDDDWDAPVRTRAITANDLTALRRIFAANQLPGGTTIERAPALWKASFACTDDTLPYPPNWKRARAVLDGRGKVQGWYQTQEKPNVLHVKEAGAADWDTCASLVAACAREARKRGLPTLRFHIPPAHLLGRYLAEHEARFITHTFRNRDGMIRPINLPTIVEGMTPEWQALAISLPKSTLTLAIDGQPVTLRWDTKKLTHRQGKTGASVALTSHDFSRLLVGFYSGATMRARNGIRLTKAAASLFDAIFPERTIHVPSIDHF